MSIAHGCCFVVVLVVAMRKKKLAKDSIKLLPAVDGGL
jgi:hypothetical protein